jgi:2-haloalkanoic acid dehalogenase type II
MMWGKTMAIKALLVDFYGTLVRENDGLIRDLSRRVCETTPLVVTPGDVAHYWWETMTALCREHSGTGWRNLISLEESALESVAQHFESHIDVHDALEEIVQSWQRPEAYSDTRQFLSRMPLPVCIVANADKNLMAAALSFAQLETQTVVTSEDARCYKPDLGIFFYALTQMGVKPAEALFVGDSIYYDIQPAQRTGMFTAWVNHTGRPLGNRCLPDVTCDNLQQLRSMIRK